MGAIGELMEMIHEAARPVIVRRGMTEEQGVNFMMAIFERVIAQTAAERPDTAERLFADAETTT